MLKSNSLRIHTRSIRKDFDKSIKDYSIDVAIISPATKPECRNRWGWGECIFLTENGCKLPFSKRPTICKYLPPAEDKKCRSKLNLDFVILQWIEYENIINCLKSINRRVRKHRSSSIYNYPVHKLLIEENNRTSKQYIPYHGEINNDYTLQHCHSCK